MCQELFFGSFLNNEEDIICSEAEILRNDSIKVTLSNSYTGPNNLNDLQEGSRVRNVYKLYFSKHSDHVWRLHYKTYQTESIVYKELQQRQLEYYSFVACFNPNDPPIIQIIEPRVYKSDMIDENGVLINTGFWSSDFKPKNAISRIIERFFETEPKIDFRNCDPYPIIISEIDNILR